MWYVVSPSCTLIGYVYVHVFNAPSLVFVYVVYLYAYYLCLHVWFYV